MLAALENRVVVLERELSFVKSHLRGDEKWKTYMESLISEYFGRNVQDELRKNARVDSFGDTDKEYDSNELVNSRSTFGDLNRKEDRHHSANQSADNYGELGGTKRPRYELDYADKPHLVSPPTSRLQYDPPCSGEAKGRMDGKTLVVDYRHSSLSSKANFEDSYALNLNSRRDVDTRLNKVTYSTISLESGERYLNPPKLSELFSTQERAERGQALSVERNFRGQPAYGSLKSASSWSGGSVNPPVQPNWSSSSNQNSSSSIFSSELRQNNQPNQVPPSLMSLGLSSSSSNSSKAPEAPWNKPFTKSVVNADNYATRIRRPPTEAEINSLNSRNVGLGYGLAPLCPPGRAAPAPTSSASSSDNRLTIRKSAWNSNLSGSSNSHAHSQQYVPPASQRSLSQNSQNSASGNTSPGTSAGNNRKARKLQKVMEHQQKMFELYGVRSGPALKEAIEAKKRAEAASLAPLPSGSNNTNVSQNPVDKSSVPLNSNSVDQNQQNVPLTNRQRRQQKRREAFLQKKKLEMEASEKEKLDSSQGNSILNQEGENSRKAQISDKQNFDDDFTMDSDEVVFIASVASTRHSESLDQSQLKD